MSRSMYGTPNGFLRALDDYETNVLHWDDSEDEAVAFFKAAFAGDDVRFGRALGAVHAYRAWRVQHPQVGWPPRLATFVDAVGIVRP